MMAARVRMVPRTVAGATMVPGAGTSEVKDQGAQQLTGNHAQARDQDSQAADQQAPSPMNTQPMGPPR